MAALFLKSSQKLIIENEEYNFDDFINILKSYNWFVREIHFNEKVYF